MILSKNTINTLRNFSKISNSLVINSGNRIRVTNEDKSCVGYADIEETIPVDVPIYELNQFLSILNLIPGGKIDFADKSLSISNDASELQYNYADSQYIKPAPEVVRFPYDDEDNISLHLTDSIIEHITKASDGLHLNTIAFTSEAGSNDIYAAAIDDRGKDENVFRIKVGQSESLTANKFSFHIAPTMIKGLIKGDYDVTVSPKGITEFKTEGHTYFIGISTKSINIS